MKVTITIEGYEPKVVELEPVASDERKMDGYSQYARFFDDCCPAWTRDSEFNLMFLKRTELYANEKLKTNGYLFLNDVYEMLGIPKTKAGQVVGWINRKEPHRDGYVDFGIFNGDKNRNFVNGYERSILLDFNVDGEILNEIEET